MTIKGYDQWKTASPYDDELDFAEMGCKCPKCGSDEYEWMDTTKEGAELTCAHCGQEYVFTHGATVAPTEEQLGRIRVLEDKLFKAKRPTDKFTSLYNFFDIAPEGDFEWDDLEAGDWHIYACGESDCPRGWHKVAYGLNMGRKDDKRFVELWSVDEDGNWEFDMAYDEREGDTPESGAWEELQGYLSGQSWDYFQGWAKYWLHVARTGDDSVEDYFKPEDVSVENAIKAAEDDIKYLED